MPEAGSRQVVVSVDGLGKPAVVRRQRSRRVALEK
jgi:hypothetical protein